MTYFLSGYRKFFLQNLKKKIELRTERRIEIIDGLCDDFCEFCMITKSMYFDQKLDIDFLIKT